MRISPRYKEKRFNNVVGAAFMTPVALTGDPQRGRHECRLSGMRFANGYAGVMNVAPTTLHAFDNCGDALADADAHGC